MNVQSGRQLAQRGDSNGAEVTGQRMPKLVNVLLWKWNQPGFRHGYTADFVNIVAAMIERRKGHVPVRVICVTDDPKGVTQCETAELWDDHGKLPNRSGERLPSCYRRLKIFDRDTQRDLGIKDGERVCSLDLDTVLVNDMTHLWMKPHHFVGWAVRGTHHLRVFNGSMWMFTAGEHQEMWDNFDPVSTPDRCHKAGYLGSDQSWLSYNFAKDPSCGTWAYPYMVSYPNELRRRPQVSKGTCIVSFHGRRKPWHPEVQTESPWIKQHWLPVATAQPKAAAHAVA